MDTKMQIFWLDNCVIGDRSPKNLTPTLMEVQGTLMSCLSSGRVSYRKGSEVLTQMACERPVGSVALGQIEPSSPPGTAWKHWGHISTPPFSQTLKLGISFQGYDDHVWQRHKAWNICKNGKILWSQTLPINYTWPLFLSYPKASHLTVKARPLVCLYQ